VPQEKVRNELTLEEYKKLIQELAQQGTKKVDLSGGEPLVRGDFFEIVGEIKKADMKTVLSTNGSLLPQLAKNIAEGDVDFVMVSIDSVSSEKHDKIRGIDGIWEKAIEGVKLLKKRGAKVGIISVIVQDNLNQIKSYIEFAKGLGCYFTFQPFHNETADDFTIRDEGMSFSKEDMQALDDALDHVIGNRGVGWVDEVYYKLCPLFLISPQRFVKVKCPVAARTIYFIDPYGNVYPCGNRRDLIWGNVRESKGEIINSDYAKDI